MHICSPRSTIVFNISSHFFQKPPPTAAAAVAEQRKGQTQQNVKISEDQHSAFEETQKVEIGICLVTIYDTTTLLAHTHTHIVFPTHFLPFHSSLFQFILNTLKENILRACGELVICKANVVQLQREEADREREFTYIETVVGEVLAEESSHTEVIEILKCVKEKVDAQDRLSQCEKKVEENAFAVFKRDLGRCQRDEDITILNSQREWKNRLEDAKRKVDETEKKVNDALEKRLGVRVKHEELAVYGHVVKKELRRSIDTLKRQKEHHICAFNRQLNLLRVWALRLMIIHSSVQIKIPPPVTGELIKYIRKHTETDVFQNVGEWAMEEDGKQCLQWNNEELERFSERLHKLRAETDREVQALLQKVGEGTGREGIADLYRRLGIRPTRAEKNEKEQVERQLASAPPEAEPEPEESEIPSSPITPERSTPLEHFLATSLEVEGEVIEVEEEGSDDEQLVESDRSKKRKRRHLSEDQNGTASDGSTAPAAPKKRKTQTRQTKKQQQEEEKTTGENKEEWIKPDEKGKWPWRRLRDPGTKRDQEKGLLKIIPAKPNQLPKSVITRYPKQEKDTVLERKREWNAVSKDDDLPTRRCPVCKEDIPGDRVDAHVSTHHNPQIREGDTPVFPCCACKEMFPSWRKRNTHQKTHWAFDTLFVCDSVTCLEKQFVFHSDQDWERHLAGVHGEKDRIKCFHCDKTTDNNDKLNRHLRRDGLGQERCEVRFDKAYVGINAVCLECEPAKTSPKVVASVKFATAVEKLEHYAEHHPDKCVGKTVSARKFK